MARDPVYDTSFTLHRLSPLHYSSSTSLLTGEVLLDHSRRFSHTLKGEVLRGVQVGENEAEGLVKAGKFKACYWTLLIEDGPGDELQGSERPGGGITNGVKIEMEYEKNQYMALLLRLQDSKRFDGEVHLPLLLTRMPNALRTVLFDYLATTFDTRVESMRLSSNFIGATLESFLAQISEASVEDLRSIVQRCTSELWIPYANLTRPEDVGNDLSSRRSSWFHGSRERVFKRDWISDLLATEHN